MQTDTDNTKHIYLLIYKGVRQGGILSPKLYSVYVDDLSDDLIESQIECQIDNVCVKNVMYADDICLTSPSPAALQIQTYFYLL